MLPKKKIATTVAPDNHDVDVSTILDQYDSKPIIPLSDEQMAADGAPVQEAPVRAETPRVRGDQNREMDGADSAQQDQNQPTRTHPEQLWETTMDPENRLMLKVTMDDGEKADAIFTTLMGSEVAPRRKFIQTHAKGVKNLDI
jgi:hypothetical protein